VAHIILNIYLVTFLTNTNDIRSGIVKRITNAKRALVSVLKSQLVLRAEEVKIYKTLIRPVATY
jgi:hypothetical protein